MIVLFSKHSARELFPFPNLVKEKKKSHCFLLEKGDSIRFRCIPDPLTLSIFLCSFSSFVLQVK